MDKRNLLLLGFAVIAIGLFIIPNTMSMFVGQHNWYSVRTPEAQYDMCKRCHWNEVGEWEANDGAHFTYKQENKNEGCFCHQINVTELKKWGLDNPSIQNYGFQKWNESGTIGNTSSSWEWRNTSTPHAALTVNCVDCHYNASQQLNTTGEAHMAFYKTTLNASGIGMSRNTACLACHTMVGLNITMERNKGGLVIYANHTNYTADGYGWTIDIKINETRTNTSVWREANVSHHGET